MGLRDLVLFYVVTGISLRWIPTAATAGPSAITVWLFGWIAFFLPLALTVIELSTRYPQEGGLYVWSKKAFGDFSGFMAGWTYWCSNLPYFPAVLYFAASSALFMGSPSWQKLANNKWYFITFSLLGLGLATLLNIVGLAVGKWLHNLGAIGTWLPIAILYVTGITAWLKFGTATHFTAHSMVPALHLKDMVFWSTIIFAFGGSESASFMGEEIKDARRNIPRALLIGGTVVTTGYILGTVCVLLALPSSEVTGLQGLMQAIAQSAARIGWYGVAPLAALLIVVHNLGAVGAWLAATARLPFVAGLDRYLPEAFGRIHPRFGSPYVALLTQSICGVIFIFLGQAGTTVKGAYEVLVSMGVITYFIPYLFTFAAMIRLQREPAGPEVIRVPGGRRVATLLAAIGFLTTFTTIFLSLVPSEDEANKLLAVIKIVGLTGVLLAVGVAAFFLGRDKAARAAAAADTNLPA